MNKYVFRKFSQNYKNYFLYEKKKLVRTLGFSRGIEHIGSTAVPGLGGKGLVDIVIGVPNGKMKIIKKKLEEKGYEFREIASKKGRLFFRKDYRHNNKIRRIHIHLVEFMGKSYCQMISFRDYLKKHPELIEKYVEIKKQAVKKAGGEGAVYRKYKNAFIKKITRKSLAEIGLKK